MRTGATILGLAMVATGVTGCGGASVAGPPAAGFGTVATYRVDPASPVQPGCRRACTQIGWVGPGPDPNTCQDTCPDGPPATTMAPQPGPGSELNQPATVTVPPMGPGPELNQPATVTVPPMGPGPELNQPATVTVPPLGPGPGSNQPAATMGPGPEWNQPAPVNAPPRFVRRWRKW